MPNQNATSNKPGVWRTLSGGIYSNIATVSEASTWSRSWAVTPNYKQLKATGDLPMQPYSFTEVYNAYPHGNVKVVTVNANGSETVSADNSGQFGNTSGWNAFVNVVEPTASEQTAVDSIATTRGRLKLKDTKVNVLQVIAERDQTYRLLGSTAGRFTRSFSKLRRGDLGGAVVELGTTMPGRGVRNRFNNRRQTDPFGAAAQAWLELQYGWKPLLGDLYGAVDFYNQRITKETIFRIESSAVSRKAWVANATSADTGWVRRHIYNYDWKYSCKFVIYYKVAADSGHTLAQLGISNPGVLAWELLPYSFVVDWFLPIGNFLASLDATVGLTFVKGCKTTSLRATAHNSTGKASSSSNVRPSVAISAYQKSSRIARSVLLDFPSVTAPVFKNPISAVHAANAISLLIVSFKR